MRRTIALLLVAFAAGCGGGNGGGDTSARTPAGGAGRVDVTNRWSLVDPVAEDVDAAALARADRAARQRFANVTGLLVARDGRLVFEGYYHGVTRPTTAPIHSITKSVVSALVGIAVRDRKLELDAPVLRYLPDVAPLVIEDDVRRITVRHLLTMSAGWVVTDLAPVSGGLEVLEAADPAAAAFARPLLARPGTRFGYDNASSHLLSIVLAEATGMRTDDFAHRELFAPLGIPRPLWEADAKGVVLGATGLHMSPRDLAKLGQLFLRRGRWGGRQLVPARYVSEATRPHLRAELEGEGYGYQWWVSESAARNYAAVGYGGQSVTVFPSLDAVVVVTSHPADDAGRESADLVYDFVLPALGPKPR